jgi:hypothetical protein
MTHPGNPIPAQAETADESKPRLFLLPYPRVLSLKGAPFRLTPSNFLYISASASTVARRKCHLLTQQLQSCGTRTTLATTTGLGPTQALFTPSASFQKSPLMERPLRGETNMAEGYRLNVTADGVWLHGVDDQGLQYAGFTLKQLLEDSHNVPGMEIEDAPLLPWRVMHLDFKGWAPSAEHLKQTITTLAGLKVNALILEYEAFFNFPSQPGLAAEGALTPDQISEIDLHAQDLGVTLIPLVPSIGNVGHILKLPAYADLREHSEFLQQFCPVNPTTLDIVTAMLEDVIAAHRGKFVHIGGDEVRLLGSNPATLARVKQLGGRAALYLEYIGKISRYLISRGRQPMVWDDMFRKMSDEQVKWLPPEVTLTFWQYEGQGGRATAAILTNLDRYRRLGRSVWGAATRTPSSRYESFDNIDAWAEAGELGYLQGLITTAWTRDHALGALLPPPEAAWPGAYYAAERNWSGKKGPTREQFPERFIARHFGVHEAPRQSRLWAGFDLMLREYPRRAREFFGHDPKTITRNVETLAFCECWSAIGAFNDYVRQFDEAVAANYANLQSGRGDPFNSGRLRWRIGDAKAKLPLIARVFSQRAARLTHEHIVREYLDSSLAYGLKRLDELESLLSGYPLPEKEWQQPVSF